MKVYGAQEIKHNIYNLQERWLNAARETAEELAQYLEDYAKTHHIWQERTGMTNLTTVGYFEELPGHIFRVVVEAGMDYDYFLEHIKNGTYAWLWPAVQQNRQYIIRKFAEAMRV